MFRDGQLPLWAKKQVSDDTTTSTLLNTSNNQINAPKGQWAQRATSSSEPSSILQLPINKDDSDCFKDDSSVDSGTETSRSNYPENQKESLIVPKKVILFMYFVLKLCILCVYHTILIISNTLIKK